MSKLIILVMVIAYLLDLIIGDPYSFPHPVRFIGNLIRFTEGKIRKIFKSKNQLKIGGFLLWIITVGFTALVTGLILNLLCINNIFYVIIASIILYTTLSTKCLADEAKKIYEVLKTGDIEKSRKQLSYIVGRDTTSLSENEIIRATVETVAENTVDGIISPMMYGFIGGPVLAMAYKAINTLDSMVGYKNEKYGDIGFASAKIDDIANFIPARITPFFMMIASFILGFNSKKSIKIAMRDRKNHKSPNCAYAEGAVAGALEVQLGGTNMYFGEKVYKPTIGDKDRELEAEDILRTNKIMYLTSFIALVIFSIITYIVL
ncbi:cobalamin biosynthesis protein [Paraclostridium bifermentans]|jgi:adenosylcobinamide-phosphate synthase|uniref:Cobalamin biosynthesis protein CobD n=1 Tax=Paraclostridium bifermentans ATCC 638 = DSM 14991 TaxID=1233171 RepID=T4VZJ1_PARBF|nr:cobalamin biosynthesis protein [Paraclostridium bifermentans]MDU7904224.1 cobalamin biosynthesis protein [Peptostreptococcaceae bacterium]EQK46251.1 cobalamin biosynthesis protein CobD [[Clostridium] bifermentans ATCC 638] [Paraclostridium bifermentans ATCC 638 = DSM 14991]MBS6509900.1 cobalamin biosynthesis protein [Paraclostridium bifermentans]MDU3804324.1 cobalamin biosynthesis protein [Paraclostridium bifermentans]RIZ57468.1 adenosylcobinamide-phosphate synthase [Paraclostridium biferme